LWRLQPMSTNSRPTRMSGPPAGGPGRVCCMSQMPDKSGAPDAVRGAGASRFGWPSEVLGTPGVGYLSHWAEAVTVVKHNAAATVETAFTATSGLLEVIHPMGGL